MGDGLCHLVGGAVRLDAVSVFGEIMTVQSAVGILLILCATAMLSVPSAKNVSCDNEWEE